jgi:hypothetical protein
MHLNKHKLAASLTADEQAHLKSCKACAFEYESLKQLKNSAEAIEQLHPPASDWLAIQRRMPKVEKRKKAPLVQYFMGAAASVSLIIVGWLSWNNHQLQNALEQQLMVNVYLEQELATYESLTYQQSQLLLKVRKVESQLVNEQQSNKKLLLLEQRSFLMTEMINNKGDKYEYSI